jgi:hypothetical protein
MVDQRCLARRGALVLGVLLGLPGLAGCFTVPGPAAPAGATQEIGADYRDRLVSRWVCKEWGSVVLAKTTAGHRLHLENLDWVLTPSKDENGTALFGFGTSMATISITRVDYVRSELITTTTELGAGVVLFAAETRPGGAILARMGGEPMVDDTCQQVSGGGAT